MESNVSGEHYRWQGQDLIVHCVLQPKSSADEIVGLYAGRLKIKITAPPVDGKANEHLLQWLAVQFNVPKRDVSILKGTTGRQKTLLIRAPSQIPAAAMIKNRSAQSHH